MQSSPLMLNCVSVLIPCIKSEVCSKWTFLHTAQYGQSYIKNSAHFIKEYFQAHAIPAFSSHW